MVLIHLAEPDKDTRYYLKIDLATAKVIELGMGNRHELLKQSKAENVTREQGWHRVLISLGQYNHLRASTLVDPGADA
ncbi:MAG TPA: hypothetical protein DE045_04875 [Oceanospirillaceae bacterium]|nr:hypothetical protein [Oceanospirillaceae bacterium]